LRKLGFVIPEEEEVVHVAEIIARAKVIANEVIEGVEVDVGEELGGLIAEGEPARALVGSEEVIPREVVGESFLFAGMADDELGEGESVRAVDFFGDHSEEDFVIDRREVFSDVAFEDKGKASGGPAGATDGLVRTEAEAAGVGIREKAEFEDGLDNAGEGMVDNAVAEGRGRDEAGFGVKDFEGAVGERPVGAVAQPAAEADEFWLKIE